MDLSPILSDPELGGGCFTLRRETWRKRCGEVIPVSSRLLENLPGNIQPASGEELKLTPREEQSQEMIQIFSAFPLSPGEPDAGEGVFTAPDLILYQGRRYRVIRVKSWAGAGGFYRAWALRQKEEGE